MRNFITHEHVGVYGKWGFTLHGLLYQMISHEAYQEAYHGGQAIVLASLYKTRETVLET